MPPPWALLLLALAPCAAGPVPLVKLGVFDAGTEESSIVFWKPTASLIIYESIG